MVTVYTMPSCRQCDQTKTALSRAGVPFSEVAISDDNLAGLRARGHMSAPVVVAPGREWSGFRPDLIRLLAASQSDVWD